MPALAPSRNGPGAGLKARYVHTNLVARDWRALAGFYRDVFGCVDVPPERDFSGPALEAGTGIPGARLHGVHLRLPGGGRTVPPSRSSSTSPPSPACPLR